VREPARDHIYQLEVKSQDGWVNFMRFESRKSAYEYRRNVLGLDSKLAKSENDRIDMRVTHFKRVSR
jgi:hypothetical protein